MNVYETAFERLLRRDLLEQRDLKRASLEGGVFFDFPAYREAVGYLRAISDVLKIIDGVSDTLNKEERTHDADFSA